MRAGAIMRRRMPMPTPRIMRAAPASAVLLGVAVTFVAAAPNPAGAPAVAGKRLYATGGGSAQEQAAKWQRSRPADAALMARMAAQPSAQWLGEWSGDVRATAARITAAAERTGSLPVLVAYNIPNRDCGSHSAGGAGSASAYRKWIGDVARGIGDRAAIVVLEPDALASTACLKGARLDERYALLRDAIQTLKQGSRTTVYLDAGHARWLKPADAAARFERAGGGAADGFALNVSNYVSTRENVAYGDRLSQLTGGKRYVIDTSRNGNGAAPNNEWCNPSGRALGEEPTTNTGHAKVDAFLWIKKPGESDGACNGGPRAGQWWAEYALGLAQRAQQLVAAR